MRNLTTLVASAVALTAFAGVGHAAITVSIYHTDPNASAAAANATLAQAAGMIADATTSVSVIDFNDHPGDNSDVYTVGQFLNNPHAGNSGPLSSTVAGLTLDNTYFYITGSTYLKAGVNSFVVPHDDGLQLNIDGFGLVLNQPGPTAENDSPFTVTAATAGVYNFELAYGETLGGPAVLRFDVNGAPAGTPEPATWAMMIVGVAGIGGMMRRRSALAASVA